MNTKKSMGSRIKTELIRNKVLYIMAIPVILYYFIFCYLPMGGNIIAFKDYQISKGIFGSEWVGLKYFKEFFEGVYFTRTFGNTLLISLYDIIFGFPAPIIFAILLNELRGKHFKKTVQTISYLPHFISLVVICGMIVDFFGRTGIVSTLIRIIMGRSENVNYMSDPKYFRTVYVATNIWQNIGWDSIIYIAAIAGIDQEMYEAAVIDGAGRFRQMLSITLPGIANTVIIMLIMRIGQILNVGYEKIILLYNSGTYETADVISSYVYRMGLLSARYSYSTAVNMFQSAVNFILLITANKLSRKFTETSLF